MVDKFTFELVSPEKLLFSQKAFMVTVPGTEGEYGILASHSPMITTVRSGVINVYDNDERHITDRIFVAGGFAEVNNDRCTVLVEEAVPVSDIDRAVVEETIRDLSAQVDSAQSDADLAHATAQLEIAHAKLQVVSAHH